MTFTTSTTELNTWSDVVAAVNANNGVIVVMMETLRDIDGYGRLGTTVRHNIQRKLQNIGIGTIRNELPGEGNAPVILFRQGSPVSEVIDVIHTTEAAGTKSFDSAAETLRKVNVMPEPEAVRGFIEQAHRALDAALEATHLVTA